MKNFRTYIIVALALVIIYLIWFGGGKNVIQYVKQKDDTEVKKIADRISKLHVHLASVVEKKKQDSIASVKTVIAYQKQVQVLKKKLASINFSSYSEKRLDSLVARTNAPNDTMYCMPVTVARQSLEAKEKLPVLDSLHALDTRRINQLGVEKFEADVDCKTIIDDKNKELAAITEQKAIVADQNKELVKDNKRERRKKIPTLIAAILIGMGIAEAVGLAH